MEECCDICGDIGSREALITCNQCKINVEHMYCMRTILEEFVDDWICEECKPCSKPKLLRSSLHGDLTDVSKTDSLEVCKDGELRAESRKFQHASREGAGNWEKMAPTGKTKYISVKEAIMLSAGDKINTFHPRGHKRGRGREERAAIRTNTLVPNFSSHQNISPTTLQPPKLLRPGNRDIPVKQLQQSKKLTGGDGHNNAIYPSTSGDEKMSNNLLLDLETYSQIPASDALWKGRFRIQGTNIQAKANHLLEAYPPSLVHQKVYDFSKRMPEVLYFKLVPSVTFRNNLFNEQIPDKRDIALYFFPGERLEEDYTPLVESISSKNLALRIQIADIELLVFSSKLLSVSCQRLEGKYYLWGVLHRLKRDLVTPLDNRILKLPVQPPSDDKSQGGEPEEVDMEIDMIGGTSVGRMDIRVPNERRGLKCTGEEPAVAVALLPESAQQIAGDFAPVLTTPPNVKIDPDELIPPGFEEIYRLRIQNLSFPLKNVGSREANKV